MAEGKGEQRQRRSKGGRQKRTCAGELPLVKSSDLVIIIHYLEDSLGEIVLVIQLSPPAPPLTCGDSYNSR